MRPAWLCTWIEPDPSSRKRRLPACPRRAGSARPCGSASTATPSEGQGLQRPPARAAIPGSSPGPQNRRRALGRVASRFLPIGASNGSNRDFPGLQAPEARPECRNALERILSERPENTSHNDHRRRAQREKGVSNLRCPAPVQLGELDRRESPLLLFPSPRAVSGALDRSSSTWDRELPALA